MSRRTLKVYLAGTVELGNPWRRLVEEAWWEQAHKVPELELKFVDPVKHLSSYVQEPEPGRKQCVVNMDLAALHRADLVFAYLAKDHYPIGTVCELWTARESAKPAFVCWDESLQQLERSPWLPCLCMEMVPVPDGRPDLAMPTFVKFLKRVSTALF